jgi:hypothetical protein
LVAQLAFPHGLCQMGFAVPIGKSYPLKSQFPWSFWRLCLDHGASGNYQFGASMNAPSADAQVWQAMLARSPDAKSCGGHDFLHLDG